MLCWKFHTLDDHTGCVQMGSKGQTSLFGQSQAGGADIHTFFSECRETCLSLHVYTTPHHICAIHTLNLITFPVIYLFFSIVLFANFWDLRATFTSPISHTYELISFLSNHLSGCEKSQTEKKSYNVTNFIDSEHLMINLLGTVWPHNVIVTS